MESAVLIGYGSTGRYLARVLSHRYEKIAIVARSETVRANIRSEFPKATVVEKLTDFDKTRWKWETTMAVIATWGPSHAEYFAELARRGVQHILCEKPLAHSVKAGADMVRSAREIGIALGTHQQRQYSGIVAGLEVVTRDLDIGKPSSVVIQGGAAGLVTMGIHYLALACELFGRGPEYVVSTAAGESINPRSPTLMFYGGTAVWSFGEIGEATLFLTNRSSIAPSITIYYRDAAVKVFQNLDVEVRRRDPTELAKYPAVTRTGQTVDVAFTGPVPGIRSFEECTEIILDEIETGDIRIFPPELALQALGACIGALTAGKIRCAVPLPIDPMSDVGMAEWPIS